jgi:hypothetical protein
MPGPFELLAIFGIILIASLPILAIAVILYFLLFKKK